jgi:penicillin-binding protein 1A
MARTDIRRSPPSRSPRKPEKPERTGWRKWLRRLFVWSFALGLLATGSLAVAVGLQARSMPGFEELKSSQAGQMIVVRARDGTELVSLGPSYGKWLSHDQIPAIMRDSMVAVEDRRYHSHFGVDPIGLARAGYISATTGKSIRATSTISQQLARTVFLNNSRTFTRKVREAVIAMALEWKFSKEEILELYLNKVYFGGGAYGVDAASRKFFGHPATTMSTSEAAIVAGLVKAPSHYSPTADREGSAGADADQRRGLDGRGPGG